MFEASDASAVVALPPAWREALASEVAKPYFRELRAFVAREREAGAVYPPEGDVIHALALTPYDRVKVVLLGQDPYHGPGQAHGLAFSVRPGVPPPPSLQNIFRELRDDLGCPIPDNGSLDSWARQGVLLLNAVLTVRAGEAHSHKGRGWETFTDAVIRLVNDRPSPVVFLLWGGQAQKKLKLIDAKRHTVLANPHPSPLSAHCGFLGCRPFSRANAALAASGQKPIEWGGGESR